MMSSRFYWFPFIPLPQQMMQTMHRQQAEMSPQHIHRHPNWEFDKRLPWVFSPTKVKTLEGKIAVENIILLWSRADMAPGLRQLVFHLP